MLEIEALAPLFEQNVPINAWDRPYKGVRTDRYTYVVYKETGEQELYDRRKDPAELRNVAADPAYARVKAKLARSAGEARPLQGPLLQRQTVRAASLVAVAALAFTGVAGAAVHRDLGSPRRPLLRDHRAQGRAAARDRRRLEHDQAEPLPGGAVERLRRRGAGQGARRHRSWS